MSQILNPNADPEDQVDIQTSQEWALENNEDLTKPSALAKFSNYLSAGYAQTDLPDDQISSLMSNGIFNIGVKSGAITVDPAASQEDRIASANDQLKAIYALPKTDAFGDLNLLADKLSKNDQDQESRTVYDFMDKAKAEGATSLSGLTPELQQEYDSSVKPLATVAEIQAARIDYAKDNNLPYIDYTLNDSGNKALWINPGSAALGSTTDMGAAIADHLNVVDATIMPAVQQQLELAPGRDVTNYDLAQNGKVKNMIIGDVQADPASALSSALATAGQLLNKGIAESTEKGQQTNAFNEAIIAIGGGAPLNLPEVAKVTSTQLAENVLGAYYDSIPTESALRNYTKDDFVQGASDILKFQAVTTPNNNVPTENFVKLSTGQYMPTNGAAFITEDAFKTGMQSLGMSAIDQAAATGVRNNYLTTNFDTITSVINKAQLNPFLNAPTEEGPSQAKNLNELYGMPQIEHTLVDYIADNPGMSKPELINSYLNKYKDELKSQGLDTAAMNVVETIPHSFADIGYAVGGVASWAGAELGIPKASNWRDWLIEKNVAQARETKESESFVNLTAGMGPTQEFVYEFSKQAAPLLANYLLTAGITSLVAKTGAVEAVAARSIAAAADGFTTGSTSALGEVVNGALAKSLSAETAEAVSAWNQNARGIIPLVAEGETAAAVPKVSTLLNLAARDFYQYIGSTIQRATVFEQMANSQFVDTFMNLQDEKNPDGSRKFTDDQIRPMALNSSLVAGSISATLSYAFHLLGNEGASISDFTKATFSDLKFNAMNLAKNLGNSLEGSGLGGAEAVGILKDITSNYLRALAPEAVKAAGSQAAEMYAYGVANDVAQNMLDNKDLNVGQAFTTHLQDMFMGGVTGLVFSVGHSRFSKSVMENSATTEQGLLSNTIDRLTKLGNNPETTAILQQRLDAAKKENTTVTAQLTPVITKVDSLQPTPFFLGKPDPITLTAINAPVTPEAHAAAATLGITSAELSTIIPTSLDANNKKVVGPQDVHDYKAQKVALTPPDFMPGADLTNPIQGFQAVGSDLTFKDLHDSIVKVNGQEGVLSVDSNRVVFQPKDGGEPIDLVRTPSQLAGTFKGIEVASTEQTPTVGVQAESARINADTGSVTHAGEDYTLRDSVHVANVVPDEYGNPQALHLLVDTAEHGPQWVPVNGDEVTKLQDAYAARNNGDNELFNTATQNGIADYLRASQQADIVDPRLTRARQSILQRDYDAPVVDQTLLTPHMQVDLAGIDNLGIDHDIVKQVKLVADQVGLDTNGLRPSEVLNLVAHALGSGIDLDSINKQDLARAYKNVITDKLPAVNLLELAVQSSYKLSQVERGGELVANRDKNAWQLAKFGIAAGADPKTILESIVRTSDNSKWVKTAKFLLERGLDNVKTQFISLPDAGIDTSGTFLGRGNVVVNLRGGSSDGIAGTLLHELKHAATYELIQNPRGPVDKEIVSRLQNLRAEIMDRAIQYYGQLSEPVPSTLRYALEGRISLNDGVFDTKTQSWEIDPTVALHEMVAHFDTSPDFHKQLDAISAKGERSFMQRFVDVIASWISGGKRLPSDAANELAKAMYDLNSRSMSNESSTDFTANLASRTDVAVRSSKGDFADIPNPYKRDELGWVEHQTEYIRPSKLSVTDLSKLITEGKFGIVSGENPEGMFATEDQNARYHDRAQSWLTEHGYEPVVVTGRYGGLGENSLLVPDLTQADALKFINEFRQVSAATDAGLLYRDGTIEPRTGQDLSVAPEHSDNQFSAVRASDNTLVPIRLFFDTDSTISPTAEADPLVKHPAFTDTAINPIAKLATQTEFPAIIKEQAANAVQLVQGELHINPTKLAEVLKDQSFLTANDTLERVTNLGISHGLAADLISSNHLDLIHSVGLEPRKLLENIVNNTHTSGDYVDMLAAKEALVPYLGNLYSDLATRTSGLNERAAVELDRIADTYRLLANDGVPASEVSLPYTGVGSPELSSFISRTAGLTKLGLYSRAAVEIEPEEVKGRVVAGDTVGSRNPTARGLENTGHNPELLADFETYKQNTRIYNKNAGLLLEYPIIAQKFPELAAKVRALRTPIETIDAKIDIAKGKISSYKTEIKAELAKQLGVKESAIKATAIADAIAQPNGRTLVARAKYITAELATLNDLAKARTAAVSAFGKNLESISTGARSAIAKNADAIYEHLVTSVQGNLENLIALFPEDVRNIAKLWYDGANIIAQKFAADHDTTLNRAAAVLAAFSPQKDWFMNIHLADRAMRIWKNNQDTAWSPAMSDQYLKRAGEPQVAGEDADGNPVYDRKAKPLTDAVTGELVYDANGVQQFSGWSSANAEANRLAAQDFVKQVAGKTLAELPTDQQSKFVRMYSETNDSRNYVGVSPDGRFDNKNATNSTGKDTNIGWSPYATIEKAIRILAAAPEAELTTISNELGNKHKIRSFYNNIADPASPDNHTTMDTHAIAAALWRPLSTSSTEVSQNFGGAGTASDSTLGMQGLYPAFAEAYRRAAETFGMLPREAQSITWEAVRLLFTKEFKSSSANKAAANEVWNRFERNEINLDQARNEVFALATGGKDLETAKANSTNPDLGIGHPSWADVQHGFLPEGVKPLGSKPNVFQTADGSVSVTGPMLHSIAGYHGTPHEFDEFSTEKIGTGEGAQAYGHGLYFADNQDVAKSYKDTLTRKSAQTKGAMPEALREYYTPGRVVQEYGGYDRVISFNEQTDRNYWSVNVQAVKQTPDGTWIDAPGERPRNHSTAPSLAKLKEAGIVSMPEGNLYGVTLNADKHELLNWNESVKDQSPEVYREIKELLPDMFVFGYEDHSGLAAYNALAFRLGSPEAASKALSETGIKGIEYKNGARNGFNYVIFNDKNIKITEANGKPVNTPSGVPFEPAPEGLHSRTAIPELRDAVADYNERYGFAPPIEDHYVPLNEQTARQIAKAYQELPTMDRSPETQRAYAALGKEIQQQYDFATKALGYHFEPWTKDGQPYANSKEMQEDVRANKHLYFFTGGEEHPLLGAKDESGLSLNDKLRAVHDLFGHAVEGYQFGPRGEENAWLKHSQMFGVEAQKALTTETRGQNSWVNFGDHVYGKDVAPADRPYAPQKVALLPENFNEWQPLLERKLFSKTEVARELDQESANRLDIVTARIHNDGKMEIGNKLARQFTPGGDLADPLYRIKNLNVNEGKVIEMDLKHLAKPLHKALEKEPSYNKDDVTVVLGTTEALVHDADRAAAAKIQDAGIAKANADYDSAPAAARYAEQLKAIKEDYKVHGNPEQYTNDVAVAQEARSNSPEKFERDLKIDVANQSYTEEIQRLRNASIDDIRVAQRDALERLRSESPLVAKAVENLRAGIDRVGAKLIEVLGEGSPIGAIVEAGQGVYLTRTYAIHHEQGYAERVLKDPEFEQQRNDAIKFFEDAWIDNNFSKWRNDDKYAVRSDDEVRSLLRAEAVSSNQGLIAMRDYVDLHGASPRTPMGKSSKVDLTRFMVKGEVPSELAALLGEHNSSQIENAIRTYTNVARFVAQQEMLNRVHELGSEGGWLIDPKTYDSNPEEYLGFVKLMSTSKTRGGEPLSNYYVSPEIKKMFDIMFPTKAAGELTSSARIIDGIIQGVAKVSSTGLMVTTIGNVGFILRAALSIPHFLAMQAIHFNFKAVGETMGVLKSVYGKGDVTELSRDLVRMGLIKDSVHGAAISDLFIGLRDTPEALYYRLNKSLDVVSPLQKIVGGVLDIPGRVKNVVEALDATTKTMSYLSELRVLIKANELETNKLSMEALKKEAAYKTLKTQQGQSEVAAVVKALSQSKLARPLVDDFIRFSSEMIRVQVDTVRIAMKEINSGNEVLRNRGLLRMSAYMAVTAFTAGGLQAIFKSVFGIDAQKEESIRAALPEYARNNNLIIVRNPITHDITVVDTNYLFHNNVVFAPIVRAMHLLAIKEYGKAGDALADGILHHFAVPSILASNIYQATKGVDTKGNRIYSSTDNEPVKLAKSMLYIIEKQFTPKTVSSVADAVSSMYMQNVYTPETRWQKAIQTLEELLSPVRIKTYTETQLLTMAANRIRQSLGESRSDFDRALRSDKMYDTSVATAFTEREATDLKTSNELKKVIAGWSAVTNDPELVKKIFTSTGHFSGGLSDRLYNSVVNDNAMSPPFVNEATIKQIETLHGPINGPIVANYIRAYQDKRGETPSPLGNN